MRHWWPYGRHKFEPQNGTAECKACKMPADHILHTPPPTNEGSNHSPRIDVYEVER
jgi:hypothetical protein